MQGALGRDREKGVGPPLSEPWSALSLLPALLAGPGAREAKHAFEALGRGGLRAREKRDEGRASMRTHRTGGRVARPAGKHSTASYWSFM